MSCLFLLCLVGLTLADQLGYNYQSSGQAYPELPIHPGQDSSTVSEHILDIPLPQPAQQLTTPPVPTLVTKEFYTFSAPEDTFNNDAKNEQILSTVKKQMHIIFIKTPENKHLEKAALNLFEQSGEEHTAIYIFTKQTDIGSLAQQLQMGMLESQSRPEVHFVKYRTQQDAANAQRNIQQQYNMLPGNSHSINGGQANILEFSPLAASPTASVDNRRQHQQQQQKLDQPPKVA